MRGKSTVRGRLVAAGIGTAGIFLVAAPVHATLIESFEGTQDGWLVPSPFGNPGQQSNFQPLGFSPTGATDGASSLTIGASATNSGSGPDYSQLLISPAVTDPYALALTGILQNAASVSLDIFAPPGSFGGFLQFDVDIDNSVTGFQSLDSFSYPSTTIGTETTITVPVSALYRSQLASSGSGTRMIIQVGGGFTANNETFYIDNIRTTAVPEPASLGGLAGLTTLTLVRRRRRD